MPQIGHCKMFINYNNEYLHVLSCSVTNMLYVSLRAIYSGKCIESYYNYIINVVSRQQHISIIVIKLIFIHLSFWFLDLWCSCTSVFGPVPWRGSRESPTWCQEGNANRPFAKSGHMQASSSRDHWEPPSSSRDHWETLSYSSVNWFPYASVFVSFPSVYPLPYNLRHMSAKLSFWRACWRDSWRTTLEYPASFSRWYP